MQNDIRSRLFLLPLITCITCGSLWLAGLALAEPHWSQFRGPHHNGSSPTTGLPGKFDQETNVRWSIDLPGPSAATPVVHGKHLFVSSVDTQAEKILALCYDRTDGSLLWSREIADEVRRDTRSTFSSPTPATDGQRVVFFYGNGDLVSFDFEGQQQWRKDLGPFAFMWTFSTSPLLHEGRLYLQILQRDYRKENRGGARLTGIESYLLALDPKTGDELWRHIRTSDAVEESKEAFSTPVPIQHAGRNELLMVGGDDISGHDPETGKELWRWGTWNPQRIPHWRLVPSPVYGNGVILACAPKQEPIFAVPAGRSGVISDADLLWVSSDERELTSDVPTPGFYDGDFFVLSDLRKTLSRVRPRTGEVVWSVATPGRSKYEASPTIADGKVYLINFLGEVTVVSADSGEILHTVLMEPAGKSEEQVRSAVIADSGQLFIRTNTKLWCIEKK